VGCQLGKQWNVTPEGRGSSPHRHPLHLHKGLLYTGHRYSLDVVRHGQRGPAIQEDFEYLVVIAVGGQDKGRDVHGEGGLGAVHRLPALPKDQK